MMLTADDDLPDDVEALKALVRHGQAALHQEKSARLESEAALKSRDQIISDLKIMVLKLQRAQYAPSSERSARLIEQYALSLEDIEGDLAEDDEKADAALSKVTEVPAHTRRTPKRGPLPAHLPRERCVIPPPEVCPCCGSDKLSKLGEDVTDTLEVIPRRCFVKQTVRERFSCRKCETITQPPAPFHVIARGRAGPSLLAMILWSKYVMHLPLNRQSDAFHNEGIPLEVSTMAATDVAFIASN
jgi:transposase